MDKMICSVIASAFGVIFLDYSAGLALLVVVVNYAAIEGAIMVVKKLARRAGVEC